MARRSDSRAGRFWRRWTVLVTGALGAAAAQRGPKSVVLRRERTATDLRDLSARLGEEGDLIIEGHDLGKGVESVWGCGEYEWTLRVAAIDTPKLMAALKGGQGLLGTLQRRETLLGALQRRFSGPNASRLEPFLKDNGVPYSFWNRVGD